ncbi:protein BANP [Nilaparvata lugens]|uniref:protein BANP n=1 Tax=Nilaparvata lugens TaxID=108931 RepID=UPI00193CFA7E|nr:protein BANP [Nilaparvata lugens]XP_039287085.1 protein BANP [Nilaparvata lugens]
MTTAIPVNGVKRFKPGKIIDIDIFYKISQQVADLQMTFTERIGQLESKVDLLMSLYTALTDKIDNDELNLVKHDLEVSREHECCKENLLKLANIESMFEKFIEVSTVECQRNVKHDESTSSQLTVLLPQKKPSVRAQLSLDSSIQAITLNTETDYPDGCWLGDENNPEARVRVPITPTQLVHIDTHCTTPSKMAIVLVDYLFPREVLAISNLSGKGKHCKKQLDPLMIYGIRCHLFHKFNITEKEWYRIKQNIDSKCRSAWHRKAKGMFLGDNKVKFHFFFMLPLMILYFLYLWESVQAFKCLDRNSDKMNLLLTIDLFNFV